MKLPHIACRLLFLAAALLVVPVFRPAQAADFPYQGSDLTVDPAIKWGRLDNGLRFALLRNTEPRGRVSARLAIKAGSFNENDNQRGLAHFLEHMAFNGSAHFPKADVIEFFQRLGMNFGGDTNASTGFDRTVYQLELPDTKVTTLRESLTWLSDVAGGILFDPAEIDKERGIILSEKRTRDSVGLRTFVAEMEFMVPDTRLPQRLPIGTEEVINTAGRDRFVEFYNAWYRPDRMVLVLVGDIEPAAVEPLVRELFGPLKPRGPALPEPRLGSVKPAATVEACLHTEMEAGGTTVAIQTVTPYSFEPDNVANRLKYLPRSLALQMLNRRLGILAKKEGTPFLNGVVGVTEQYDLYRNAAIELNCRPDQWQAALTVAEQELRRAFEHGFQPEELAEAVAGWRNALDQAVRTAPTRRSPSLADDITGDLIDDNVTTHPVAEQALYLPALAAVTPEACTQALRAAWSETNGRKLFIAGNVRIPDAPSAIAATYATSAKVAVAAPPKTEQSAFGYTDFGPAGTVKSQTAVDDLGVTLIQFANGVRLNLKPTDFEAGRIQVSVRVDGGKLTMPMNQPGIALLASVAFIGGGLGKHSVDDLERILAGKTVGLSFAAQTDAFALGATTNRADLLLQLQLFCAYLTDPGFRPESLRQVRKSAEQLYLRLAHSLDGPMQLEVASLLSGGDPRFGLPPEKEMLARSLDELKAWLVPQLATGPIEIAVVGDFDPAAVISAVSQTFGALPPRAAKPDYAQARKIVPPASPLAKQYSVESEIPKALVRLYWPATDGRDVKLSRRLRLLSDVFGDRLRLEVREKLGATYSPNAGVDLSDTYPGYGWIAADATVAPGDARKVADAIKTVAAGLYEKGVTEEELVRAKQPILTALRESSRTNGYWLGTVLAAAQEFPERLDWSRTRYSDNESVTAAELTALARQYLVPAKVSEFIVVPVQNQAAVSPPSPSPAAK
ncbi:MAG TPA: insulinase family protein [Lacunisphaera sp.]|nr:insulinase family protein [Lacunisphaera sp.]